MSPAQCRAARTLIGWTQPQLANAAGIGLSTVVDFEKGRRAVSEAAAAGIRTALEAAGITFLADGDAAIGVGVSLRR